MGCGGGGWGWWRGGKWKHGDGRRSWSLSVNTSRSWDSPVGGWVGGVVREREERESAIDPDKSKNL